jgi:UTP--glucose-1-phosphate uridylyltransferase
LPPSAALAGAVVPVAGLGTRLLPLTRVVPKALLPLAGKPVVERVVDELRGAGIERICLVTSAGAPAVEAHFDDPGVVAVRQPSPRGLGDAVLCAEEFAAGRPFVLALGDCVYRSPRVVDAVVGAFSSDGGAVAAIAVERVPPERLGLYGVVTTEGGRVMGLVEKPSPEQASGDLAVAARYVLGPTIFDALRGSATDPAGELGLTDALVGLMEAGERVLAVPLPDGERRLDAGTLSTYTESFVELALAEDPALRERLCE